MARIVGVRPYSFEDRETGNQVEGVSVFCIERMDEATGGRGDEAYKLTFPGKTAEQVFGGMGEHLYGLIGKQVKFEYNRGGKRPVRVQIVKQSG